MTDEHHDLTGTERLHMASILCEIPGDPTAHQIDLAKTLARSMAAWVGEAEALRSEGTVIQTPTGLCKMNPRVVVSSNLFAAILRGRRSLQIHARALHGETARIGRRREIAKSHEADNLLADDLLAKPSGNA